MLGSNQRRQANERTFGAVRTLSGPYVQVRVVLNFGLDPP